MTKHSDDELKKAIDDALCKLPDGFIYNDEDYRIAVDKLITAVKRERQAAERAGRIDELENIYEWGYPGSANIGVGSRLSGEHTLESRLAQLKGETTDD